MATVTINGDEKWFISKYDKAGLGSSLMYEKELHMEQTAFQEIRILQSTTLGNVLLLEGEIQVVERDEYAYHEMMVHLPMCCHPNPRKILIIGGGDGGCVREILKHQSVQQIVLCDIDERVIDICKEYLPSCAKYLNNEKVQIVIDDGIEYVKRYQDEFDVIFIDVHSESGAALDAYQTDFYENIHKALRKDGLACAQGENMINELIPTTRRIVQFCKETYPVVEYANAIVPSFTGGHNGFILISKNKETDFYKPCKTLTSKDIKAWNLGYYNTPIHQASLCLPQQFIEEVFDSAEK